jgi:prophage regulatory protein
MEKRDSFMRLPQVQRRTGFSRSTIYKRVSEGTFPRQISLGGRCVAWLESDIDRWIEQRVSQSKERALETASGEFPKMEIGEARVPVLGRRAKEHVAGEVSR